MTEVAERPTKLAVSERGRLLRHTEAEVDLTLKLLVLNGGKINVTEEMLLAENVQVHRNTIRAWRDDCFPRRYAQIRHELGREVTEEIAGRALERAMEYGEAERAYIEAAINKLPEVSPDHLAKNAQALSNAKNNNVQMAQLLRDRPTEIIENRSLSDYVEVLERLGVAQKEDEAIEGEAVDEG